MFCNQCGQPLGATDQFCNRCGARTAANAGEVAHPADARQEVVQAVAAALAPYPQLVLTQGRKSDLEISNVLADGNWTVGKKRVEYSAYLLADASARTVTFWEMIKEVGCGMGALFSFKKTSYRSDGKTLSGSVQETGYGFGGKVIDYNWDYAQVRSLVEEAVRSRGWRFETTLRKGKATY